MRPWFAVLAFASLLLLPLPARAEDPAEDEPLPTLATDEEAEAALEVFKEEYRARGLRGDERTAQRERAMRRLAEVQHASVADRLAKLTRDRDVDIRTLAVMYLGEQRALPGYAGPLVEKALLAHVKDPVFVMFAIESIEILDYRGSVDLFRNLLRHKDEGVQKVAMLVIGDMVEMRLLDDMIQLMKDLKIDKGVKWEGGEVTYDTGTPGTHDQEMAEKIYKEKYGSKAKAGKRAARAMRDMKPIVLEAMKRLTGEEFVTTKQAVEWAEANAEEIEEQQNALDELQKQQEEAADAL